MAELKETGSNETKSSAGDKHETALAMLQIEQANVGSQLNGLLAKKAVLEKIDAGKSSPYIINGSLVKTDHGYFFISIAAGKISIDDKMVTAISLQSALGIKLMGLKAGDKIEMPGRHYRIESIE